MSIIDLPGCTAEPLMSYLKSLGLFRLVVEQEADPAARLSWTGGACRLHTTLDRASLAHFLLNEYRPTPILAPWNGGSGFYGGGSEPLEAIAGSAGDRLARYRDAIEAIRTFIPAAKPKDEQKGELLRLCRAELPDEVVPWLDACFVLGESGPGYFPLLGTGGNDGRLDFTNNFMQRLADVIPFDDGGPTTESAGWLDAALFGDALAPLKSTAIGQFNPGGIGGANGTQGRFEADSRVNPWDFVLMIEGTLLFAGSVARRLGANATQRSAFPFTVRSVAVGYGSASPSEETTDGSRAELWLPLWGVERAATLAEVAHLFAEGRAQFGRRQANNAVEFALATSLLGVDRGVEGFARYGFLKRNGLSYLATPLGRVTVTPRPRARLLDDAVLNAWLDRLRSACSDKAKTPDRYQTALRRIDRALFGFAVRSEVGDESDRRALTEVLRALGRAEQIFASGLSFCEENRIRPLHGLSARWLDDAHDGSQEFGLAASLAGIGACGSVGPMRAFMEEVDVRWGRVNWSPGSTSAVWKKRSLAENLATVFRRRQMEAFRDGQQGTPLGSTRTAGLQGVASFLSEETDDVKLAELIWGLSGIDWSSAEERRPESPDTVVPFEFGVLRLLVEPREIAATRVAGRRKWMLIDDDKPNAKPEPGLFEALATGRSDAISRCVDDASRRLKSGGRPVRGQRNRVRAGRSLAVASPFPPHRLLAAMLFPLSTGDLATVANAVLYPPEDEE